MIGQAIFPRLRTLHSWISLSSFCCSFNNFTYFNNQNFFTFRKKTFSMMVLTSELANIISKSSTATNIKCIKFRISFSQLIEDAKALISLVFPFWEKKSLTFEQLSAGTTNKLVRCINEDLGQTILIRAYGRNTEVFINRRNELNNMLALANLGEAKPLYAQFDNGLVYGYQEGQMFKVSDLKDPYMATLVAKKLAKFHKMDIPNLPKEASLWTTLDSWLSSVPKSFNNPEKDNILYNQIMFDSLRNEIEFLRQKLSLIDSPVVFSHNDLLAGNIILGKGEAFFIDHEYASYNYRGFDIGNHFNEYAGFECEYSQCPGKEEQIQWLKQYFLALNKSIPVKEEDLEQLYVEVNAYSLASHIYWGLWALLQASLSDLDFDYLSYALGRFQEYYKQKDAILSLLG